MFFHLFDPMYFVFVAPALLLMLFAQFWVKRAYAVGMQIPARLSGAAAARYILDEAGCQDVAIEEVPGTLSDHYDPRCACAQAFQRHLSLPHRDGGRHRRARSRATRCEHAHNWMPLIIRNAAVPAATFGGAAFSVLFFGGVIISMFFRNPHLGINLMLLGVLLYCGVLVFQLINLPVEFDASARAKRILANYQIVDGDGAVAVNRVLNAAALTYVAAMLLTLLEIAYYLFRILGSQRN